MTYEQEQQLIAATRQDPIYQELLHDCEILEKDYLRINGCLSPEDQTLLERYITLCEELEHRRTQLVCSIL